MAIVRQKFESAVFCVFVLAPTISAAFVSSAGAVISMLMR